MRIVLPDRGTLGADLSLAPLQALGEVITYDKTPPQQLAARLAGAEVAVINKARITDTVLAEADRLRLICVFATGYDNVDLAAARARGVAVCNVPAYSTDSVALFTVSTVLALATGLLTYRQHVHSGAYTAGGVANCLTPVYHELRGRQWGIVGYGNIGRAVARVAEALGARVAVCRRRPEGNVRCVDIDTLCLESDILTVHCPLTQQTRGLIGRAQLAMLPPHAILVNTARGGVVDEAAVAEAVLQGRLGGFGSDVYSVEPFPAEHPFTQLLGLPQVCLTPHAAWGAYEARERCLGIVTDNIRAFEHGEIKNRVDIIGQN